MEAQAFQTNELDTTITKSKGRQDLADDIVLGLIS